MSDSKWKFHHLISENIKYQKVGNATSDTVPPSKCFSSAINQLRNCISTRGGLIVSKNKLSVWEQAISVRLFLFLFAIFFSQKREKDYGAISRDDTKKEGEWEEVQSWVEEGQRKGKGNRIFNRGRKECLLSAAALATLAAASVATSDWYSLPHACQQHTGWFRTFSLCLSSASYTTLLFPPFCSLTCKHNVCVKRENAKIFIYPFCFFVFFAFTLSLHSPFKDHPNKIFWIQNLYIEHASTYLAKALTYKTIC